jgi:hypothetical protein
MENRKDLSDAWITELAEKVRYSEENLPDPNVMPEFEEPWLKERSAMSFKDIADLYPKKSTI